MSAHLLVATTESFDHPNKSLRHRDKCQLPWKTSLPTISLCWVLLSLLFKVKVETVQNLPNCNQSVRQFTDQWDRPTYLEQHLVLRCFLSWLLLPRSTPLSRTPPAPSSSGGSRWDRPGLWPPRLMVAGDGGSGGAEGLFLSPTCCYEQPRRLGEIENQTYSISSFREYDSFLISNLPYRIPWTGEVPGPGLRWPEWTWDPSPLPAPSWSSWCIWSWHGRARPSQSKSPRCSEIPADPESIVFTSFQF